MMSLTSEQQQLVREKTNHFLVGYCLSNTGFLKSLIEELNRYKWPEQLVAMLELHIGDPEKVKDYLGFDPYAKSD